MHDNLAKRKQKANLKHVNSQAHSSQDIIESKQQPLRDEFKDDKYLFSSNVKTQKQLFLKRKKDFLEDMKKCEAVYANHKNAEQRLNQRED